MNTDPQFTIQGPLLPDMVRLHGKWYPQKAALIDEVKTLTWQEIDQHSNQVANGLIELGISKGDSVALLMNNCVEFAEIMFGIMKAGAVVVPLNVAVNEQGLVSMLNDSNSRALFFTDEHYARMKSHLDEVPSLLGPACFVHGELNESSALRYSSWRSRHNAKEPGVTIEDDAPCNIIYSSGTTGLPKGIKHLHRRRIQSMYELALAHRYHFGAIAVCPIGLYSNIAWASLFCSLIVGGSCVIQTKFTADDWVDTVQKYQVSHTMMVPLQFQKVLEAPNFSRQAVASLEAVISGGSPLFDGLKKRVNEQFDCAVIELYGLTEGFMTTLQPEEAEGKLSSVGKPVRGNDYIIVDDNNAVLSWGNSGEICVRSVHWMVEYHNRPDATAEVSYVDDKGLLWLRTGDIGRVDNDGYLYIVDRKKDMILSGGQNIYPADIEAIMVEHKAIAEVAVIGIPHEKWGETALALVVLQNALKQADAATQGIAETILAWTNERVGKRQRLSELVITDELPRNPNGKILKRELRKQYRSD